MAGSSGGSEVDMREGSERSDNEEGEMHAGNKVKWKVKNEKKRSRKDGESMSDGDDQRGAERMRRDKRREQVEEWKVMAVFDEPTRKVLNPIALSKAIEAEVGHVRDARCVGHGRVLIFAVNWAQQGKLMTLTSLNGAKVKCHVPGGRAKSRGVITGVPLDITMEEFKKEVKGGRVVEAKRMTNKNKGNGEESPTVMVEFDGHIPSRVCLGYVSYFVREYVPAPLRCFKCQRMGHVASVCKGQCRCAKCGGPHEYGKCEAQAKIRCCNCGGEHSAAYGGCIVQRKEAEVQRYKIVNKVTYAEAARKSQGSRREQEIRAQEQPGVITGRGEGQVVEGGDKKCSHGGCSVTEETLVVKRVDFLAFMCHILNMSEQVKKKSARIEMVVRAAKEFMGIMEVTGEMLHGMLAQPKSGDVDISSK